MRTKDFDKQNRIKQAMVRLILREGINGASVAKIAREAGVSPATIYVYYESKEAMLSEVFQECSHQSYRFLLHRLRADMDAAELIDAIVRGTYDYTVEHEEAFSFVEQCSRCPTLSPCVSERECVCELFSLIHARQARGEVRACSDGNLAALLFQPVRYLALHRAQFETEAELSELIGLLQNMLLP